MITLTFVVPVGNGYTKPTIKARVMPHLKDLGHGWELVGGNDKSIFEIQTMQELSSVELQVAKLVLQRHYGFQIHQTTSTFA